LNKLTTIADDIALSLGASGVRIAAIPGKISVVGIEVPNRAVTTVSLRDVIDSAEFSKAKSKSSFAVGKDIGGTNIVGNIAKLPHMLIAGTTGSGKSVCMNSIIISLLYKASPDDVKLIMIDPKMVELGIYNGIPHLLIPVVTDPKKAAGSLQWAVTEMMRRYKTMSDAGVRDLESYNSIAEHEEGQRLPQVVVIIDELADLMLVAAKEVEESICRIAQMGRAAGIHLVIATQRPSADVITGLMKANIPSRIAFAVASAMESRIILDTQGAEKLVGKGDMLFSPIGSGKPLRVQGCFVSDPEVEAVASYVKENYNTNYDQTVMDEIEKKAAQTGSSKSVTAADPDPEEETTAGDEMLPAAVDVFMETGQASVSMLQRRLKLGYARAARIVDEMEEKGIVGPFQGSKPRAILVTKEQWEAMKAGVSQQMEFSDMGEPVPEEFD
jgi:S-DNA-T family DNA segregation ATPase FtsK/SpoIIIE